MPTNSKPTGQRRSHVTTACTHCRQNKLKCDGQKPSCGTCLNKGHKCEYQLGKDKRQFSIRKVTDAFSRRVNQLEQFIRSLNVDIPPIIDHDDASVLGQIAESMPLPTAILDDRAPIAEAPNVVIDSTVTNGHAQPIGSLQFLPDVEHNPFPNLEPGAKSVDTFSAVQPLEVSPGSGFVPEPYDFMMMSDIDFQPNLDMSCTDWIWSIPESDFFQAVRSTDQSGDTELSQKDQTGDNDSHQLVSQVLHPHGVRNAMSDVIEGGGSSSEDEHDDEIIEQLSTRFGDLQTGAMGELRYYGPTSNLTLTDSGTPSQHRNSFKGRFKVAQTKLEQAGQAHKLDLNLIEHLIELYFTWQDPSCHIIDKVIFYQERALYKDNDCETSLYSVSLEEAICALGALIYDGKHPDLPRPLSEVFANRAKILLEYELDSPKIATVQTFSILSCHEATRTRDSRGWIYAGTATRIALDLGLHIDTATRVAEGSMSSRTAHARSVAFWGSYLMDQMWGFYLGRPCSIRTAEITLPLPSVEDTKAAQHVWTPTGTFDADKEEEVAPILDCSRDLIALQWVTLCQLMSSLTVTLYGREEVNKDELVNLSVVTLQRLRAWRTNLPPSLQCDIGDESRRVTPHVLLLHMQYHVFVIIQHRPFISKAGIQPYPPRGDGPMHARRMCLESAIEVARLLDAYATNFPLRLSNTQIVHITFSAALILVYAAVSESDRHRQAVLTNHLATCCDTLAELGDLFENAARSLETLLTIKRAWQARLVAGTGHKRRNTQRPGSTNYARWKRMREDK